MEQKYHWMTAVLAIALFPLRAPVTESLTWTAEPSNQTEAIKGQHVSLTWRYSLTADELTKSNTFLAIRWRKFHPSISTYDQFASRSRVLNQGATYFEPSAPRIVIDRATGTNFASLEINNVRLEDEGSYKIEISVEFPGTVIAAHDVVNLTVSVPPEIVFVSNDMDVCQGSNVNLSCYATGVPSPSITWTRVADDGKDSAPLPTIGGDYILESISRSSNGTYRCTAGNPAGTVIRTVQVMIRFPTSVTSVSNTTVVKVGENVTLLCSISGDPAPNVSWVNSKNDLMIVNSTWEILNIGRNYTGEYKCIASNECGSDSKTTNISVEFSPSATSNGRNETVLLGTPINFTCPVDGNPPPSVRWYKGSEPSGTVLSSKNEFEFTPTSLCDTGLYTCFAYNYLGNIIVSFGLKVVEPPSPATPSPTTPREMTVVQITLIITNEDCNNFPEEEFRVEVKNTLGHLGLKDIEIKTRCGSVIVDLGLGFNQRVGENDVMSTMKTAARNDKFGHFNVDPDSIRQISSFSTSSPSPTNTEGPPECSCSCNTVLGVIIGILVAIIIVLIIIIVWQHKKGTTTRPYEVPPRNAGFYDNEIAMKDIRPTHVSPSSSTQKLSMSGPGYMELQEVTRSDKYRTDQSAPTTSQQQNPSQPAEYAPLNLRTRSWEVARDNVAVDKIIGKGAFGQVAKATAIQLPFSNGKTTVAVKMLKPNAPEADKKDLLSELELMKTLKPHPHIIKLMGCVTLSEPLLVLIEYVPYGDLLGYLRKSRGLNDTYYKDPDVKPRTSLTSQQLMKFAWQIADGMSYLSSRKVIHRDLAARNVLVGERETCKVTDFGMARDVQQEDIYEKKTRCRLPVKWTAYESLLYGTYTTKSDVWSYGVVLYEIFTIGGSPYPRMDGKKIANALQHGYRMPKPQHVDDALYQIMMNCWQKEPEARPSFPALTKQLKEMEKQHKRLINMHIYDNELYGNLDDLNV